MPKKQTEAKKTVTVKCRLFGKKLDNEVTTEIELDPESISFGDRVTVDDLAKAATDQVLDRKICGTIDYKLELEDEQSVMFSEEIDEDNNTNHGALVFDASETLKQRLSVKVLNGREALAEFKARAAKAAEPNAED